MSRPASLRRALGLRLAAAGLASTLALLTVLVVVYAVQRQRLDQGWLADARAHFERQSQRVDADWVRQAELLRAQIELSGVLDGQDERLSKARIIALLAVQGGQGTFTHVYVLDATGRTLLAHATRSGPPVAAPARGSGDWRLVEAEGMVYRVLRTPLWLGARGVGELVLQVPMNNALLASVAFPGARISLHWQGRRDLAESHHSLPLQPSERVAGRRVLEGQFPWGIGAGAPALHVTSVSRDALSAAELAALAAAGVLGAALLAWMSIGRWARRHVQRIDALATAMDGFARDGQRAAELGGRIAAATAQGDVELQRLAAGLGELMTAVEAANADNAAARARLAEVNATLEQRVEERTHELAVARDEALAAARTRQMILASVSHELRTPLVGLLGSLELADAAELPPDLRQLIEVAQRSGHALRSVIDDVLDYSRQESVGVQLRQMPFRPDRLAAEAVALHAALAANKSLALGCHCEGAASDLVRGDPMRLRQVLLNLIGNAIKFTDRGSVDLRVGAAPAAASGRLALNFQVSDTGIGIDDDLRARLFSPFTRADPAGDPRGGTGLGLAIAQRLVAAMGGQIEVDSRAGHGACFHFTIELPTTDAEAPAPVQVLAEDPSQGLVLLVDDNAVNRMIAGAMLRRMGLEVDEAENGLLAIESLRRRPADLVLMDHEMPVLDGLQTSQRIRAGEAGERAQSTPIVAVTAHALDGAAQRCLAAGMNDYLPKPFTQEGLERVVARWLGERVGPGATLR